MNEKQQSEEYITKYGQLYEWKKGYNGRVKFTSMKPKTVKTHQQKFIIYTMDNDDQIVSPLLGITFKQALKTINNSSPNDFLFVSKAINEEDFLNALDSDGKSYDCKAGDHVYQPTKFDYYEAALQHKYIQDVRAIKIKIYEQTK